MPREGDLEMGIVHDSLVNPGSSMRKSALRDRIGRRAYLRMIIEKAPSDKIPATT